MSDNPEKKWDPLAGLKEGLMWHLKAQLRWLTGSDENTESGSMGEEAEAAGHEPEPEPVVAQPQTDSVVAPPTEPSEENEEDPAAESNQAVALCPAQCFEGDFENGCTTLACHAMFAPQKSIDTPHEPQGDALGA